jgi:drug/metabolite transporter (DMT)-like permease
VALDRPGLRDVGHLRSGDKYRPLGFSNLIGVYTAVFVLTSVLVGRFVLDEHVPAATWIGAGIIMLGGLVIQFSST